MSLHQHNIRVQGLLAAVNRKAQVLGAEPQTEETAEPVSLPRRVVAAVHRQFHPVATAGGDNVRATIIR